MTKKAENCNKIVTSFLLKNIKKYVIIINVGYAAPAYRNIAESGKYEKDKNSAVCYYYGGFYRRL